MTRLQKGGERVEDEEMAERTMSTGEVARALGVSRQRADQLSRQAGFPKPVSEALTGRRWRPVDVRRWAKAHGRSWAEPGP